MDEIETRLKTTVEQCISTYNAWNEKKSDADLRGALQEAVHELRKVSARLEIEIATSERDQMTQKPIPVPPHRSANRRTPMSQSENAGNKKAAQQQAQTPEISMDNMGGPKTEIKRRRRTVQKPAASSGE
tara:strand:+ start:296450 stop:296839 length:390 start_codon:yes stop_codon:yes gene_type:complete